MARSFDRFTVSEAESMIRNNLSAMRKAYTEMRDVAQKRIKRMGESAFSESRTYQQFKGGFQKLKDIDKRDFAKAFSELSKFVGSKASSISGQRSIRDKTIATWQEQGLNLNAKNYDKAIKILEEMRRRKITYGSDKVVELADSMLSLDDQQTSEWLDHLDTLLEHSDEVSEIADQYDGFTAVDIDDLINDLGW